MHDLDLQQLAEAAMLQQSREDTVNTTRSNPRRNAAAGASNGASTANTAASRATAGNAAVEDDSHGNANTRRTRQRSSRSSTAAGANAATAGETSSSLPANAQPSSFARSPSSRGAATNASAGNAASKAGSSEDKSSGSIQQSLDGSAAEDKLIGEPPSLRSSIRQAGIPLASASTPRAAPASARSSRRKDKKHRGQRASISSINTVKSSLSNPSAATSSLSSSTPALSHTTTDPSISSAASDISSRNSEGTHATTPEHVSSLEGSHVIYAKASHPSYSNANHNSALPSTSHLPYPVYHDGHALVAHGKSGPAYHHHLPTPNAILTGGTEQRHQSQHAYTHLQGRPFDPSQVQLYPHEFSEESGQEQSGLRYPDDSDTNASAAVQYFIDPYALPSNHPYHPSQTQALHSTSHLHGGSAYASSVSAPPPVQDRNHQPQHHYSATALPPLPNSALGGGSDYLMQYSNAPQQHHQPASNGGYSGNGGESSNGHRSNGLDASTSAAANVSGSSGQNVGELPPSYSTNEDGDITSGGDNGQDDSNASTPTAVTATSSALVPPPTKKQKGRRPTNTNLESKNHRCSFPGCSWSFSRREHLRRHEKTHTQERPFVCDVPLCNLRFSRLDNLNSHKRTHDKGKRTSQWHVAKVVGSQQAAAAAASGSGSGSVMGEGSEDGRGSVEGSSGVHQQSHTGHDDYVPPHSAGESTSSHYVIPGNAAAQQNGFPPLPPLDNGMSANNGNGGSTVGAEVRFAYYDPSPHQSQSGNGGQHHHDSMAGLGGPYGNVRGYQDPFSYQPHGVPVHPQNMPTHSHLPPHLSSQQQQLHHPHTSYHHQPLPPLPPSMHDESAYMHHQQQQHHMQQPLQQQQHLQASGMVNGMPPHHEYENMSYTPDDYRHLPQTHLVHHVEQQQHPQHLPPQSADAPATARTSGSGKRKRNESHRSNNSASTSTSAAVGTGTNTTPNMHAGNQMESPSHKRRQSGRKGGAGP